MKVLFASLFLFLISTSAYAAAPSLKDISIIIPGPVFGLFKYIESFDFTFGFGDDPKTVPEIVESVPKTHEEARGFFFNFWAKVWGLIKGIGEFLYSIFQGFAGWLHNLLGLPDSYESWRK